MKSKYKRRGGVFSLLLASALTAQSVLINPVYHLSVYANEQEESDADNAENRAEDDVLLQNNSESHTEEDHENICVRTEAVAELQQQEKITVHISDLDDYLDVAEHCHYDSWSANKIILLDTDLDLTAAHEGDSSCMIPVFAGIFDGQGHCITGVIEEGPVSGSGMFGTILEGAVVKDLSVSGAILPSGIQKCLGGITGYNCGTIDNCMWDGTVQAHARVGGIAGHNMSQGKIISCTAAGNIQADAYAGGIAGYNEGIIQDCTNQAAVNTVYTDVPYTTDMLTNTLESILMTGQLEAAENISVRSYTGGIAGYSSGIIRHSANQADIGYEHTGYHTGGIAGGSNGLVSECTNEGNIKGRKNVAGIVGQQQPYMELELLRSTLDDLDSELDNLDRMVDEALNSSSRLTNDTTLRLNQISNYAGLAKENVKILSDDASIRADQAVEKANRITASLQDSLHGISSSMKNAGAYADKLVKAAGTVSSGVSDLVNTLHLSEDERSTLQNALDTLQSNGNNITEEIQRFIDGLGTEIDIPLPGELDPSALKILTDEERELLEDLLQKAQISDEELQDMTVEEFCDRLQQFVDAEKQDLFDTMVRKITSDEETIEKLYNQIMEKAQTAADGVSDLNDAGKTLYRILKEHENELLSLEDQAIVSSFQDLGNLLKNAPDLTGEIGSALDSIADTDMMLQGVDETARTAGNGLYSSLGNLMNEMNGLNSSVNSGTQEAIGDIKQISSQIQKIIGIVENGVEAVSGRSDPEEHIEDVSDQESESSVWGRVSGCINKGIINADTNVGGIIGLIGISLNSDPEQEIVRLGAGNSIDYVFRTKGIVDHCQNSGDISSRNGYAGGIAGRMEMGLIRDCTSNGAVSGEGDFTGGIAGYSAAQIKNAGSRCRISGTSYVGGIAGFGNRISDCLSMVTISKADAYSGAIAGGVKELDQKKIFNNYYYAKDIYGINGVAYDGIAEEADHDIISNKIQNISEPVNPGSSDGNNSSRNSVFNGVQMTFMINGTVKAVIECPYGGNISPEDIPDIPEREGFYGFWSRDDFTQLTEDEIVEAQYKRIVTLLAGAAMRDDGRPVFLVDGEFTEDDDLTVMLEIPVDDETADEEFDEIWDIEIPDDGSIIHTLRFLKAADMKDADLYVIQNGMWNPVETSFNGQYQVFSVQSNQVMVGVKNKHSRSLIDQIRHIFG